jgi:hypothetical protein
MLQWITLTVFVTALAIGALIGADKLVKLIEPGESPTAQESNLPSSPEPEPSTAAPIPSASTTPQPSPQASTTPDATVGSESSPESGSGSPRSQPFSAVSPTGSESTSNIAQAPGTTPESPTVQAPSALPQTSEAQTTQTTASPETPSQPVPGLW